MANFEIAYAPTAQIEAGYSNDVHDLGGETYAGLTRRDWPNWDGWKTIDSFKGQPKFISIINSSQQLKDSVKQLFKANYWDTIKGDLINDQQVASQVFDTAINMGVGTASKMLQNAAEVKIDGIIGQQTINAVNALNGLNLYNAFIALRKAKYEVIIANNPSQEVFRKSWLSRMPPYKI